MTIFWPFLEKTENSRIQMYGTLVDSLVARRYCNCTVSVVCVIRMVFTFFAYGFSKKTYASQEM